MASRLLGLTIILWLQFLATGFVHAQVSSSFPYNYQGDSATWVVLNDLATTDDGGVIGVGYVDYNSDTTGTVYWTRSLIVKFNAQGELLWEKIHHIGGYHYNNAFYDHSKFTCILPFEDGFLVAGQALANGIIGSRVALCKIDQQGDTLWCKDYGLPPNNAMVFRMMLHDNEVIMTGSIASPSTPNSPSGEDGLLIRVTTDGVLLDIEMRESYYDSLHHSGLRFRGMDIDGIGKLRIMGHAVNLQVSNGVTHHNLQLFDMEDENLSLLFNDSLTTWRPPNNRSGAVSEGHRSYSDTTVIYGYGAYPNYGAVRAEATEVGVNYTALSSNLLPPGHVIYNVSGAVHYGEMDFVYGSSWLVSSAGRLRLFALAVHRESSQPVVFPECCR